MLLFFQVSFPLRPHLVTFVCLIVLGIFLLRHREAKSWTDFWPMALLQIAWTNCHSAFILGPAMVGFSEPRSSFANGCAWGQGHFRG